MRATVWLAGDLLAALLLAKLYLKPGNMQHAVEHATASLQGILLATVAAAGEAAHTKERTPAVSIWLCCAVLCCTWECCAQCMSEYSPKPLLLQSELQEGGLSCT